MRNSLFFVAVAASLSVTACIGPPPRVESPGPSHAAELVTAAAANNTPTPIARAWLHLAELGPLSFFSALRAATVACPRPSAAYHASDRVVTWTFDSPCIVPGIGVLAGRGEARFWDDDLGWSIEIIEGGGVSWFFRQLRRDRVLAVRSRDVDDCHPPDELHLPPGVFRGALAIDCATVLLGTLSRKLDVRRRGKAFLVLDRDERTLTIAGHQVYLGTGATRSYAAAATRNINQVWTGGFHYEDAYFKAISVVTGRARHDGDLEDPLAILVDVVQTDLPLSVTSNIDPSHQSPYGFGHGLQHSTDIDDPDVNAPAHEFGHVLGLDDEYKESKDHLLVGRHTVRTGPEGGLMGDGHRGSRPTEANYRALVSGEGLLTLPSANVSCSYCTKARVRPGAF
jgi:hypothetical protein